MSIKSRIQAKKEAKLLECYSDANFRVEGERIINDHGEEFIVAPPTLGQSIGLIVFLVGYIALMLFICYKVINWTCDLILNFEEKRDRLVLSFKRIFCKIQQWIKQVLNVIFPHTESDPFEEV